MTNFSELINPELKRQILEERKQSLIVEGFQNQLARDQFLAIGDNENAAQHEANVVTIAQALAVVEQQLSD